MGKRHTLDALITAAFSTRLIEFPGQWCRLGYDAADAKPLLRWGYLQKLRVLAVPPVDVRLLFESAPGGKKTDFAAVAYAASLMSLREPTELTVLCGTRKLERVLGGCCPGLTHWHHTSHNLALTEVLAMLRKSNPDEARRWVGETVYVRRHRGAMGRYVPDAAIAKPHGGRLETAVEFVGPSYTQHRLLDAWRAAWTAGMKLRLYGIAGSRPSSPSLLSTAS